MKRLHALVILAFAQNLTLILVGEGAYFYTHHALQFTNTQNLLLALGRGACFVAAALSSHALSRRLGERRQMYLGMAGQAVCYLMIYTDPADASVLVVGMVGYNLFAGLKWPVIESYFSAGTTPRETLKAVGWFNLSWSASAPIGMMLAGPIISIRPALLFALSAGVDLMCMSLLPKLEAKPAHLELDHPQRPPAEQLGRYAALLASSRWSMMISYALFYMISPLLPSILDPLAGSIVLATLCAASLHVARFVVFVAMRQAPGWHGRAGVAVGAIVGLPIGFVMIITAQSLTAVIVGQLIFGAASGLCYYAALYYAMVIKNSSVSASGKHEATIGSGLIVGPVVGLAAMQVAAMAVYSPFLLVGAAISAWPLRRLRA